MGQLFYITYWWKKGSETGFNHHFHEIGGEMTAKEIVRFSDWLQRMHEFDDCTIMGWQKVECQ
ncbi:hypothetical protein MARILYN_30 [Vibrio phage Marilyn]|nr:hypothetical protein MARILYN_30 [Vibrio phage Marilyn]WCD55553.1 hypothetical protein FAYDEN_30 [Vibrio phage Fayden]WCD55610.1 hypothetical protein BAYBAE_30 [Vibrio phage Baybae]WCD55669.1 hypothetical protein VAITEPHAGE_30 [Vibrio phage Vaitephage]